jgi:hypothetical protein
MVCSFWLSCDILQAYDEILYSFDIDIQNHYLKYFVCALVDIIIHVLPLIIIGLPQKKISIIIALIFVSVWYIIIKENASHIYTQIVGLKLHYALFLCIVVYFCCS